MSRGSGADWDMRKNIAYEIYRKKLFNSFVGYSGDCFDRYLIRLDEMRQSIDIISYCINVKLSEGIKGLQNTTLPARSDMKNFMESTIRHFKSVSAGIFVLESTCYLSVEAPKGEFGLYLESTGKEQPDRIKIRAPGFYHLQGLRCLTVNHLLADVVTIIGTADIVFGEVDR
jgi:NADH:ubiquinone oxidoreductase subunit D